LEMRTGKMPRQGSEKYDRILYWIVRGDKPFVEEDTKRTVITMSDRDIPTIGHVITICQTLQISATSFTMISAETRDLEGTLANTECRYIRSENDQARTKSIICRGSQHF
jgi:hypothetical protein